MRHHRSCVCDIDIQFYKNTAVVKTIDSKKTVRMAYKVSVFARQQDMEATQSEKEKSTEMNTEKAKDKCSIEGNNRALIMESQWCCDVSFSDNSHIVQLYDHLSTTKKYPYKSQS